ncbi:Ogfr [Symbiodinium sp. KB8]|nr:Ogfr [Symbiodinium sp. KB8]
MQRQFTQPMKYFLSAKKLVVEDPDGTSNKADDAAFHRNFEMMKVLIAHCIEPEIGIPTMTDFKDGPAGAAAAIADLGEGHAASVEEAEGDEDEALDGTPIDNGDDMDGRDRLAIPDHGDAHGSDDIDGTRRSLHEDVPHPSDVFSAEELASFDAEDVADRADNEERDLEMELEEFMQAELGKDYPCETQTEEKPGAASPSKVRKSIVNDAAELPEELRELLAEGGNVVDATETLKQQRELKKAAKASIPKQKKASPKKKSADPSKNDKPAKELKRKATPKKKSADPSKNHEPAKELKRKASVLLENEVSLSTPPAATTREAEPGSDPMQKTAQGPRAPKAKARAKANDAAASKSKGKKETPEQRQAIADMNIPRIRELAAEFPELQPAIGFTGKPHVKVDKKKGGSTVSWSKHGGPSGRTQGRIQEGKNRLSAKLRLLQIDESNRLTYDRNRYSEQDLESTVGFFLAMQQTLRIKKKGGWVFIDTGSEVAAARMGNWLVAGLPQSAMDLARLLEQLKSGILQVPQLPIQCQDWAEADLLPVKTYLEEAVVEGKHGKAAADVGRMDTRSTMSWIGAGSQNSPNGHAVPELELTELLELSKDELGKAIFLDSQCLGPGSKAFRDFVLTEFLDDMAEPILDTTTARNVEALSQVYRLTVELVKDAKEAAEAKQEYLNSYNKVKATAEKSADKVMKAAELETDKAKAGRKKMIAKSWLAKELEALDVKMASVTERAEGSATIAAAKLHALIGHLRKTASMSRSFWEQMEAWHEMDATRAMSNSLKHGALQAVPEAAAVPAAVAETQMETQRSIAAEALEQEAEAPTLAVQDPYSQDAEAPTLAVQDPYSQDGPEAPTLAAQNPSSQDGPEAPTLTVQNPSSQDGPEAPTLAAAVQNPISQDGPEAPTTLAAVQNPISQDGAEAPTLAAAVQNPISQDGAEAPTLAAVPNPISQDGAEAPTLAAAVPNPPSQDGPEAGAPAAVPNPTSQDGPEAGAPAAVPNPTSQDGPEANAPTAVPNPISPDGPEAATLAAVQNPNSQDGPEAATLAAVQNPNSQDGPEAATAAVQNPNSQDGPEASAGAQVPRAL